MPKRLRLRYASAASLDAYLPHFKSAPEESAFCRDWHGLRRQSGRELPPGAERLGLFEVEAQAYGSEDTVVLATARRAQ